MARVGVAAIQQYLPVVGGGFGPHLIDLHCSLGPFPYECTRFPNYSGRGKRCIKIKPAPREALWRLVRLDFSHIISLHPNCLAVLPELTEHKRVL